MSQKSLATRKTWFLRLHYDSDLYSWKYAFKRKQAPSWRRCLCDRRGNLQRTLPRTAGWRQGESACHMNLMTQFNPQNPEWKDRTDFQELPSDLCTCAMYGMPLLHQCQGQNEVLTVLRQAWYWSSCSCTYGLCKTFFTAIQFHPGCVLC